MLARGVDIKVVIPCKPERPLGRPFRHRQFERVEGLCKRFLCRLADQQMYVLGHDYVADDAELVTNSHSFQNFFKEGPRRRRREIGLSTKATEGDEMKIARILISLEALGHAVDCRTGVKG